MFARQPRPLSPTLPAPAVEERRHVASTFIQALRRDGILYLGGALAAATVFSPTLHRAFDRIKELEQQTHLALVPGLAVLFASIGLHQLLRRQQVATAAAASAADARVVRLRAEELERLVSFERAVASSLDLLTLREHIEAHLPALCGLRDNWVLLRLQGQWEAIVQRRSDGGHDLEQDELERLAAHALDMANDAPPDDERANRIVVDGHICLPLRVAGNSVGVLGVVTREMPVTEADLRTLEAAAGILAIGAKNIELVSQIREHGLRDGLTGCFNRAHALETLQVELRRAQRSHSPVSVVMLDLDHFKSVNDRHGHLAGDAVLVTAGRLLRDVLRTSDLKCRYGGEEFLMVLPETSPDAARVVAEMLRGVIARTPVPFGVHELRVTGSLGVVTAAQGETDAETLVARADEALYAAKRAGRNCVRVAMSSEADATPPERQRAETSPRHTALH
jgi:diguanylate cyclase (GGDEF)-like protein